MPQLSRNLLSAAVYCIVAGCASEPRIPNELTARPPHTGASTPRGPERRATPLDLVLASLTEQARRTRRYDPSYAPIGYPNGDVLMDRGVCSDVIVRAFREVGLDLQKEVHEDMSRAFNAYPAIWGLRRPDRNIDHRRVANLMRFFERRDKEWTPSRKADDYQPGDVVAWELQGGRLHVGMVTLEVASDRERHLIVHNIGAGANLEDVLFAWKIIGHYRWFALS